MFTFIPRFPGRQGSGFQSAFEIVRLLDGNRSLERGVEISLVVVISAGLCSVEISGLFGLARCEEADVVFNFRAAAMSGMRIARHLVRH
jgi:hypothetical protein